MFYHIGLEVGLTVADIDKMTAGEILDLLYYKVNRREEAEKQAKEKTTAASQADYDGF